MEKSEVLMPEGRRRRYTDAFKMEAVRLVRESAHPVAQVARDLGIPDNVLYRWTAQHRQAEAPHGPPSARRPRNSRA
jgi:transposase